MATRADVDDEEAARELNQRGWRQCSVFRPPADHVLDDRRIAFDRDKEWLIVCSQSCTVCSRRFQVDPVVEVAVAVPVAKFNGRSPQARGGDMRKLMLPIVGVPGVGAIECYINRRTFLDRRRLLDWHPDASMRLGAGAQRQFQGWLAQGYVRIAMPDALVIRLGHRPDGLFARVRAILDGGGEDALHAKVPAVYIQWSSDEELPEDTLYSLRLLFACEDDDTLERLGVELETALKTFQEASGRDGIVLARLDAELISNITLQHANRYHRLSSWDELSELGEVAEHRLATTLLAELPSD